MADKITGLIGEVVYFDPSKGEKGEGLIRQIYPDKNRKDGKKFQHQLVGADFDPDMIQLFTPHRRFNYEAVTYQGPQGQNWWKASELKPEDPGQGVNVVEPENPSIKNTTDVKRIRLTPDHLDPVYGIGALLCVKTYNDAGEAHPESVTINSNGFITIKDLEKKKTLVKRATTFSITPVAGSQNLLIEAAEISTLITFTHDESHESTSVTLNYR